MEQMNNIILIGFMGCGKSSLGKYLANKQNLSFKDTDKLIEKQKNLSVQDIFTKYGEEHFRKLETSLIHDLYGNLSNSILSTGGGLPITEGNGELLRRLGVVVFLRTTKDTIKKRLAGDTTRPLLAGDDSDTKITTLLNYRTPFYEKIAHIIVDTDNKSFAEIANEIVSKMKFI